VAHVVPGRLDPQFEAMELFPVRLVVGLRERHPLRASRSIRELYKAEWILPGDDHFSGREAVSPLLPLGLPPPARVIQGQSVTVALALVGQMDLIGLFVEPLATLTFKRHGIRRVEIEEELPMLSVSVIKRRGQLLTPAAQHFVECIQRASAAAMGGQL
jgi:DNA-binding transcriptional LysR family regulator